MKNSEIRAKNYWETENLKGVPLPCLLRSCGFTSLLDGDLFVWQYVTACEDLFLHDHGMQIQNQANRYGREESTMRTTCLTFDAPPNS